MNNAGFDLFRVDTVLFDLDGTLVDTNDLIMDSWRYTIKELTGRDATDEEIRKTFGEILLDSMKWIMPDVDPEEALDFYRKYQREIFLDRISLYEGVEEVLCALKNAGYKNALVTSRLKTSTERALAHFGLNKFFDAVLTASDTDVFKPDPAPIFLMLEKLGSKPGEAILIGDTVHDIEAGRAAGVFTVLVGWSFALPPEKWETAPKPDAVIEKMPDLLALLNLNTKEIK